MVKQVMLETKRAAIAKEMIIIIKGVRIRIRHGKQVTVSLVYYNFQFVPLFIVSFNYPNTVQLLVILLIVFMYSFHFTYSINKPHILYRELLYEVSVYILTFRFPSTIRLRVCQLQLWKHTTCLDSTVLLMMVNI